MVIQLLKDYGYQEKGIEKIIDSYALSHFKGDTLFKHIEDNFQYFLSLGYTKKQIIKMTVSFPAIYGYSIENMKQKLSDMEELGYTRSQAIKMTVSLPSIYSLSIKNMKQKLSDMEELGYTRKQSIKMTVSFSAIYSYSIENMKQKLSDMGGLGYTRSQAIKMTVSLPSIYSLSIENIKEKVEYFREIGIEKCIVDSPNKLIQSVDLTCARYCYLTEEKNIDFSLDSAINFLFLSTTVFERRFGISKKDLLEKYPKQEKQNIKKRKI